jgi:hypothetical protein
MIAKGFVRKKVQNPSRSWTASFELLLAGLLGLARRLCGALHDLGRFGLHLRPDLLARAGGSAGAI